MLPYLVIGGGLALLALFRKKTPNGPILLASLSKQYGSPTGTENWTAPSGRNYRVTHWVSGYDIITLALGGSWANQPTAPNSLYAFRQAGDIKNTFVIISASLPDAASAGDMMQLRTSNM